MASRRARNSVAWFFFRHRGQFSLFFSKSICSHHANTSAIRHVAAGAGCRFWLDPALVRSGCCGRASDFLLVFFFKIQYYSRRFRERVTDRPGFLFSAALVASVPSGIVRIAASLRRLCSIAKSFFPRCANFRACLHVHSNPFWCP